MRGWGGTGHLGTETPFLLLPFPFLIFFSFGANASARDTKLELKEEKNFASSFRLICHVFFVVVAPDGLQQLRALLT